MNFTQLMLGLVLGFGITVILMPIFIPFLHKLKFGQAIRAEGPKSHQKKSGTPTMGGVVFVISAVLAVYLTDISLLSSPFIGIMVFVYLGFALIGFVDDFIIVVQKNNKGLPPRYKFLAQSIITIVVYYIFKNYIGISSVITTPIFGFEFDLGWFYPLFIFVMFTGESNGVNLSDGLDGLSSGLCIMAFTPFVIIALMKDMPQVALFGLAVIGSLLGFLVYNHHPAKIFMGDVGALALGGLLAVMALLTKEELLVIIVGGMFLIEILSDIIQIGSFKLRGKRVFKMAPIHHHFELSGWSETQVVLSFWFMGFIFALLGILIAVL